MTNASGGQPSTTSGGSASAGKQIYHGPLYGIHDSHHTAAEPAKISIQGLTSGFIQPLDFCIPVTRSHPGNEDQRRKALHGDAGRNLAVEHINISTAWNGLSDVDASELFRVHRAFVSTLEKMLANELWQIYQQFQQQDSAGNIRPIHTLFSAGIVRGISFCHDQLVSEMAEILYSSKENVAKAKSGFLQLYLIATDALVQYHDDDSRDTSITVRVHCDPSSPRSQPVVDAAWVPDSLIFEALDEFPVEGQNFSIIPRYYSKSAFRLTHFPKNVKYFIESESRHCPLSWLVWDEGIAGFKGIVPFYSEINDYDKCLANTCPDFRESIFNSLKIIVQAVLVDENGPSIRYERILRARLTIKVVPWYANDKSRATKERSIVPKTYLDTRLASAAQRFALQGPQGNPIKPGQSPSRPSQQSQGAHLFTPKEVVHLGLIKFNKDYSTMSSPATVAGLKETDLPSRAQIQAYLVAKCAELARELENVKEQVMVSGPFSEHQNRTLHIPDPLKYPNDTYRAPSYHHTGLNGSTSGFSVPCVSHDASEHLTTPSSPFLRGRDATFQPGSIARCSVLPPSAIDQTARATLDLPTFNDGNVPDATRTGWDPTTRLSTTSQFVAPEGGFMAQGTHSTQEPGDLWRLPEQASISLNDTGTAHFAPRPNAEALSIPPMVSGELATLSTSGKRGRKLRARSSLNKLLAFRNSLETGKQPKQEIGAHSAEPGRNTLPLSNSEDEENSIPTWSSDIFYNSFGPLRNIRNYTTRAGKDVLALHTSGRKTSTNSGKNIKHRNQDSECSMDTGNTDSDEPANKTSHTSSGPDDRVIAEEGAPSNSFFTDWKGQVRLRQSSLASFSHQHASASSTSDSCSTSSDMEFIVEQTPCARKVSRGEQARLWNMLSQSDSDKENQTEPDGKEVRLSEDEKKAMEEAMRRSLDDLAEGFDDIFLEDSSESSSSNDL